MGNTQDKMEEELSEYFDVVEEDELGILVKHQESSKHFQLQEPKVANPGCNEKNKELDPQFYCHTCNKNLSDQNSFIRHNMKHADDKYECEFCDFKSGFIVDIEKHHRVEHPGAKRILNCPTCEFFTSSKDRLRMHIRYIHKIVRKYNCEDCEYETNHPDNLREHQKENHGVRERFPCSECDASLSSRKNVLKHIRYFHRKNIKLYLCSSCDFETKYRHYLVKHMSKNRCKSKLL